MKERKGIMFYSLNASIFSVLLEVTSFNEMGNFVKSTLEKTELTFILLEKLNSIE